METAGEKKIYEFYNSLPSPEKIKAKLKTTERIRKMAEELNGQENTDNGEDEFQVDIPEDDE